MSEFVGVVTTSVEGEGSLRLVYPADKVAVINDSGKLGLMVEGQEKGVSANEVLHFANFFEAVAWIKKTE